MAQRL